MTDPTPRRLVQIGKFYPPEWGGIETFAKNLADGIATRGIASEAVVFTRAASGVEQVGDVRVDRSHAGRTISSQPISISWLFRAIRRARGADVVLIHYPNVLAIAAVPFLSSARIVTYWHSDVINKGVMGRIIGIAERYLLRRSDLVLASTSAYAKASPRLRAVAAKTQVLAIGIDDVTGRECQQLPASIAGFVGDHGRLILAVGRLVRYKGFDVLIRAAATMPADTRVVIVGSGPEHATLETMIDELGVRDRVLLAGRQDDTSLHALFQAASAYAMSSVERSEAYAIVQVEAMAHGIPIVATDIPGSGVPEVSGHGETGALVAVGDAVALGRALLAVMDRPDDMLRKRARARFEARFTTTRMVDDAVRMLFGQDKQAVG